MIISRPSILIYTNKADAKILKEICAGIEEEGLLYQVEEKSEENVKRLAYDAANTSVLGSGIGISKEETALQMRNVDMEKPLFYGKTKEVKQCRKVGINSARAVKRRPFCI